MLRDLLAQLLTSWPHFILDIVGRLRNFEPSSVDDLKDSFVLLVEQLSSTVVVFCFLDAITILERQA